MAGADPSVFLAAKVKAEQGRVAGLAKVEGYRNRSPSGSSPAHDSAPAPAPPSRGGHVPSPPARGGSQKGVFVGMDDREKEAFFSLLDQYFETRPEYRELFAGASSPAPTTAPSSRRAPPSAPAAAASPPPPPPRARGLGMATALYSFEGQDPAEDLSFGEGDQILVLEHGELFEVTGAVLLCADRGPLVSFSERGLDEGRAQRPNRHLPLFLRSDELVVPFKKSRSIGEVYLVPSWACTSVSARASAMMAKFGDRSPGLEGAHRPRFAHARLC